MKINETHLKRIIKEEVAKMNEMGPMDWDDMEIELPSKEKPLDVDLNIPPEEDELYKIGQTAGREGTGVPSEHDRSEEFLHGYLDGMIAGGKESESSSFDDRRDAYSQDLMRLAKP